MGKSNLPRHKKMTLREIFEYAVEDKHSGVRIEYIWNSYCDICGTSTYEWDEEYSFEYVKQNGDVTLKELENELEEFAKDYSIYDGYYEEEVEPFIFIKYDPSDNVNIYYYYVDSVGEERCEICHNIFGDSQFD